MWVCGCAQLPATGYRLPGYVLQGVPGQRLLAQRQRAERDDDAAEELVLLQRVVVPEGGLQAAGLHHLQRQPVLQHLHERRVRVPLQDARLTLRLFRRVWY